VQHIPTVNSSFLTQLTCGILCPVITALHNFHDTQLFSACGAILLSTELMKTKCVALPFCGLSQKDKWLSAGRCRAPCTRRTDSTQF